MQQVEIFHETIEDAQGADINACGGFKEVARKLFPNKSADGGYAYLKNCLREDKGEKLGPEDLSGLVRLARQNKSFATINFICSGAGLSYPQPIEPEDKRAELQRAFIQAVKVVEGLSKRLESFGE